eukprot:gene22185-49511_t
MGAFRGGGAVADRAGVGRRTHRVVWWCAWVAAAAQDDGPGSPARAAARDPATPP